MNSKPKNDRTLYVNLIALLCAIYAISGLYFLVNATLSLWQAKGVAIQGHMPLVVYLQVLGNYMLIFMYALVSSIIFIIAALGIWRQPQKYTPFTIVALSSIILYSIESYLQYRNVVTIELFTIGVAITLLSLFSIIYLLKHSLFKGLAVQQYSAVFQRYRYINLYIYVIGLYAFLKFFLFLILFLYYGEYVWQSGVQWPIPSDETVLKILLSYSVVIFMISIFCASKLWEFQNKMRLLTILLLLCTMVYYFYFLYYAVINTNYGYIIQSCIYIVINSICILYVKKHQFPAISK